MIAYFMEAIRKELKATGCPIAVEYGLEKFTQEPTRDEAFLRDADQADEWTAEVRAPGRRPVQSEHSEPRARMGMACFTRKSGTLLTVYARSSKAGATEEDHHNLARTYAEKIMVIVRQALEADGATIDGTISGGFEPPPEGTTQIAGARYTLGFKIANVVADVPWPQNDPADIETITTTITVEAPGLEDSTEECSHAAA